MDCEKFDRIVLDQLYQELDELTSLAAKRHVEHCMRCRRIEAGLRATREVGVLPMVEPPESLVSHILAAEREAHAVLPARQRFGRAISILAGYAMRPQLAMAALLVLMIGGSLLFLRGSPDDQGSGLAERGVPEGEGDSIPILPVPERAASGARQGGAQAHGALDDDTTRPRREPRELNDEPRLGAAAAESKEQQVAAAPEPALDAEDAGPDLAYDEAMSAFNTGRYADAEQRFDEIARTGGAKAAAASLFAAQAARNGGGCAVAAPRFEEVANRFPGTGVGNEAAWQAADCQRQLGLLEEARRHYRALLATPYANRAQQALAQLESEPVRVARPKAARAAAKSDGSEAPAKRAAPPAADTKSE